MADVHDPDTRRKNMKAVRNHDTGIETCVAKILEDLGFEFRAQVIDFPGKPDFVIDNYRKIIFTHGCFWHRHECSRFKFPETRTEFWTKKIEGNVLRDKKICKKLRDDGWLVMIIWECAIKGRYRLSAHEISERIEEWICTGNYSARIDTKGISNNG